MSFTSNTSLVPYNFYQEQLAKALTPFSGDPFVSNVSNLMISSISGNASLKDAQVICMSDFHYDVQQKHVRAHIINEIMRTRHAASKVFFLLEGSQAGHMPNQMVYEKLVGKDLIQSDHFVAGWDNMKLLNRGMNKINDVQHLRSQGKELEKQYRGLQQRKSDVLRNTAVAPEKIFEELDSIEALMKPLQARLEAISQGLFEMHGQIKELAGNRNQFLHKSVHHLAKTEPGATIFVIAGEEHFKSISSEIGSLKHCILKIRQIRKIVDIDQALSEVYGKASSVKAKIPK